MEEIHLNEHPLIYLREGATGRRPALLGSRLDVADIITTIRQNDGSTEETASYLEVPAAWVEAAARYYAAHPDEVDAQIERARLATKRERLKR